MIKDDDFIRNDDSTEMLFFQIKKMFLNINSWLKRCSTKKDVQQKDDSKMLLKHWNDATLMKMVFFLKKKFNFRNDVK